MKQDSNLTDEEIKDIVQYALLTEEITVEVRTEKGNVWTRVRRVITNVRMASRRERIETVVAARILKKFILTRDITEEEKAFLKEQSIDIARILPIVAVQAVPAPVPITPFLIMLGKKIGIDIVPKEQEIPDEYKKESKRSDKPPQS